MPSVKLVHHISIVPWWDRRFSPNHRRAPPVSPSFSHRGSAWPLLYETLLRILHWLRERTSTSEMWAPCREGSFFLSLSPRYLCRARTERRLWPRPCCALTSWTRERWRHRTGRRVQPSARPHRAPGGQWWSTTGPSPARQPDNLYIYIFLLRYWKTKLNIMVLYFGKCAEHIFGRKLNDDISWSH